MKAEDIAAGEEIPVTTKQINASLILLLTSQILVGMIFLFYFISNAAGGILIILLTLTIAIIRRLANHLFSSNYTIQNSTSTSSMSSAVDEDVTVILEDPTTVSSLILDELTHENTN
jgi:hypothetical protein